jgi:hypothetical protein
MRPLDRILPEEDCVPEIRSIAELIALLSDEKLLATIKYKQLPASPQLFGVWFRGQANSTWKLVPKLLRSPAPINEYNMFATFKLRHPERSARCRSSFDVLCLLQHYGMPTRLLDWSASALIALHFALDDQSIDGKLLILNALEMNKYAYGAASIGIPENPGTVLRAELAASPAIWNYLHNIDPIMQRPKTKESLIETAVYQRLVTKYGYPLPDMYKKEFGQERDALTAKLLGVNFEIEKFVTEVGSALSAPWAVMPYQTGARMKAQNSVFTLHGGSEGSRLGLGPSTSIEQVNAMAGILLEVTVPAADKERLRKELELAGIHEGMLFPDLEHQVAFLKEAWTPH